MQKTGFKRVLLLIYLMIL